MSYRPTLLILSNVAAFTLMVVVNGLAGSTTLLEGDDSGRVRREPHADNASRLRVRHLGHHPFPAGGLCHPSDAAFTAGEGVQKQIGWLFVLSSILNMIWLFAWQYEQLPLSVLIMLLLLGS